MKGNTVSKHTSPFIICKIETTTDTLTGRGGLALFSRCRGDRWVQVTASCPFVRKEHFPDETAWKMAAPDPAGLQSATSQWIDSQIVLMEGWRAGGLKHIHTRLSLIALALGCLLMEGTCQRPFILSSRFSGTLSSFLTPRHAC